MSNAAAKFTSEREIPELWTHQKETEEFCLDHECVYDTSDPGTGKTAAHLTAFARYRRDGAGPALISAPKTLLETAWGEDAKLFVPDMRIAIAWAHCREAAFNEDADIYIVNVDGIKWLAKQKAAWLRRKFANGTLIIDEITAYKNHTSAQRAKDAIKVSKYFDFKRGLTGTPFNKSVTEMWAQVNILDGGQRLGKKFYAFRQTVCEPEPIPGTVHQNWVDKPGAEEAVSLQLADISIRHKLDDCMDIPKQHSYYRTFSLSNKALKAYKEMETTASLEVANGAVTAVNAAVLRNKLLQIASGAVYDANGNYHLVDRGRYELVTDLIKEHDHSLAFFLWQHQKEELSKLFERAGIPYAIIDGKVRKAEERADIVRRYQAGEFQTLLLHPDTGAHGLTLTRATRTIWTSPIYRSDWLIQGNARTRRGKQDKRTEVIKVHAENTVESLVYEKLETNEKKVITLLDLI